MDSMEQRTPWSNASSTCYLASGPGPAAHRTSCSTGPAAPTGSRFDEVRDGRSARVPDCPCFETAPLWHPSPCLRAEHSSALRMRWATEPLSRGADCWDGMEFQTTTPGPRATLSPPSDQFVLRETMLLAARPDPLMFPPLIGRDRQVGRRSGSWPSSANDLYFASRSRHCRRCPTRPTTEPVVSRRSIEPQDVSQRSCRPESQSVNSQPSTTLDSRPSTRRP